jgi:hypothetical protein
VQQGGPPLPFPADANAQVDPVTPVSSKVSSPLARARAAASATLPASSAGAMPARPPSG